MPAFLRGFLSRAALGGGLALSLMAAGSAHAAINVFQNDLAGFNLAGNTPAIVVTFDDPTLDDISFTELNGISFNGDNDGLIVVDAADTSPNPLPATSGLRILSPGGADLVDSGDGQADTVTFSFGPSIAFGLDVLFQAGYSGDLPIRFEVRSSESGSFQGELDISDFSASGSYFIGFVSDNANDRITSVTILDNDDASNLGYDTLRRATTVPEPSAWALMIGGLGLTGGMLRRRRQAALS